MCLEPHGSTCEWKGDKLTAHLSTQNVSGTARPVRHAAGDHGRRRDRALRLHRRRVRQQVRRRHWGCACDELAKETGRPVKFMLDRDQEQKIAGSRPSGFHRRQDRAPTKTAWSKCGIRTTGAPAAFKGAASAKASFPMCSPPPNFRRVATPSRPTPLRCGPGELPIIRRLVRSRRRPTTTSPPSSARTATTSSCGTLQARAKERAEVYAEEMKIAATADGLESQVASARQRRDKGYRDGLGMAIHTWGGGAHNSTCMVKIHPDGGVETFAGQPGPGHRHPHRHRHGAGRDIRPAGRGRQGQHRQLEVSGQRPFGRQHHRGRL